MARLETYRCEASRRGEVTTPSHFFVDYSRERERLRLEGAVPASVCPSAAAASSYLPEPRRPSASPDPRDYEEQTIYRAEDKE